MGVFFRALACRSWAASRSPYLWVPEWHKTGHGLHLHFAVGRFVPRGMIERAWGHGFVHIKLLGGLPVGSGSFAESRKAAGYLSKYVAKSFDDDAEGVQRPKGLHRFDVAQGFKPRDHADPGCDPRRGDRARVGGDGWAAGRVLVLGR